MEPLDVKDGVEVMEIRSERKSISTEYIVDDDCVYSASEDEHDYDDIKVSHITMWNFYKPRTLIALTLMIGVLIVLAFIRDQTQSVEDNYWSGIVAVFCTFIVFASMTFPNGPFTRPHPIVWRIVLGISVVYLLALIFCLFQSYDTVKNILYFIDPELKLASPDTKVYKVNCDKWKTFVDSIDVFTVAHFVGNVAKAMVLRHAEMLWVISIMWEITELAFIHLLPNFAECWWDSLVLDVLLCNGLGIYTGLFLCKLLEMKEYKWESFKAIEGTKMKLKRVILQFTPESWSKVSWMCTSSPYRRYFQLCLLVLFFQINELNCFFLKHIFIVPSKNYLNLVRLGIILILVAPGLRQYYLYISDARCNRLGTHCWVFIAITFVEAFVCIKHGMALFKKIQLMNLIYWLLFQFFICILILGFMMMRSRKRTSTSTLGPKVCSSKVFLPNFQDGNYKFKDD